MQRPLLQEQKTPYQEEASVLTYLRNVAESFRGGAKEHRQEYKVHLDGRVQPKEIQQNNRVSMVRYRSYVDQLRPWRWLYLGALVLAVQLDPLLRPHLYILLVYIFLVFLFDTACLLPQFRLQKKINRQIYKFSKNIWFFYKYQDVEVGHILELSQNQMVPNDMVVLYSENSQLFLQDEQGRVHRRTSLALTQQFIEKDPLNNRFHDLNHYLLVRRDGSITLVNKSVLGQQAQVQVIGENIMPKYHKLVSTSPVFGIVIKNWNDKSAINQPTKQNHLQKLVKNVLPPCLLLVMATALFLQTRFELDGLSRAALLILVSFDWLLSFDLALVLLDYFFRNRTKDQLVLSNGNLVSKIEEVKYLMMNPTEALLRDKPRIRQVAIGQNHYSSMEVRLMKSLLKSQGDSPAQLALENLLECLVINHRLLENKWSPDCLDGVFLDLAEQLRFKLLHKDSQQVKYLIEHRGQDIQHFKVHYQFIHHQRTITIIEDFDQSQYVLFCKGSLQAMKEVFTEESLEEATQVQNRHSPAHLHTIYFGRKILSDDDFFKFDARFKEGLRLGMESKQLEDKLLKKIERKLVLAGAIGVEQSASPNAKSTLDTLKNKGIRPWVISHLSPEETLLLAKQLGMTTGPVYSMLQIDEFIQIQNNLNELDSKQGSQSLLIDHGTLKQCLRFHKRFFFEVCAQVPCVLLAEVQGNLSSVQKLKEGLVRKLKEFSQEGVMALGTCNQDQAMLQSSDLAVALGSNRLCRLVSEVQLLSLDDLHSLASQYSPQYQAKSVQVYSWVVARSLLISATHLVLCYVLDMTTQQHYYYTVSHSCLGLVVSIQALLADNKLSTLHGISTKSTMILSTLYSIYQVVMLNLLCIFPLFLPQNAFSQPESVLLSCCCLIILDILNLLARIRQLSASSLVYLLLLVLIHGLMFPLFCGDPLPLMSQSLGLSIISMVAICFVPVYLGRVLVSCLNSS